MDVSPFLPEGYIFALADPRHRWQIQRSLSMCLNIGKMNIDQIGRVRMMSKHVLNGWQIQALNVVHSPQCYSVCFTATAVRLKHSYYTCYIYRYRRSIDGNRTFCRVMHLYNMLYGCVMLWLNSRIHFYV